MGLSTILSSESHNSSKYADCYMLLAKHRTIFVSEDITKDIATSLSALLLYYDHDNSHEDISLYINTNGGDALALANIYDVMKMIQAPIKTICIGKAYSAGAFILASGTKGKRFITRNSSVMIHGLQTLFPYEGADQKNSQVRFDFLKSLNVNILSSFATNVGKSFDEVYQDCKSDNYLTAIDAKRYGIVDEVI